MVLWRKIPLACYGWYFSKYCDVMCILVGLYGERVVLVIISIMFSKSYRAENDFTCNSIMTWRILRYLIDSITSTVMMSSSVYFISAASSGVQVI